MSKEKDLYQDWATKLADREASVSGRATDWDRYLRYYRMDLNPTEGGASGDNIWINYQYGLARILLPSIYFQNPEVVLRPRGATPEAYCFLLRDLINYELKELAFEDESRKSVFDAFFCGIGVMKFGFAPALRRQKTPSAAEKAFMMFQAMFEAGAPEAPAERSQDDFDPNQRITDDLPFAVRISPRGFLIDKQATCLEDARWVAHRLLVPVEDVQKSGKYTKAVTRGIEATHRLEDDRAYNEYDGTAVKSADGLTGSGGDPGMVVIYEVWDREHDELLVLDSYNMGRQATNKFLRKETSPYPGIDGFPFELLVFNPDPEVPYGLPDAMIWHNPAQALNLIDSMAFSHIKRFNRKYVAREGAFASEEVTKLQVGADGTIIFCRSAESTDSCITPLQDAPISGDIYNLREIVRNNMTFLSGVTEQRKGTADKARTATEASIIEQQARIRDNDRSLVVSKFVTKGVRKLLQLSRQFLDPNNTDFLKSDSARALWQLSAPEIIKSEVDVEVNVGSSAFVSKEIQVKQYLDFLNVVGPMTEMVPTPMPDPTTGMITMVPQPTRIVDVRKFAQRIASEMNIPNWEDLLTPPPNPQMGPPPVGPSAVGGGQSTQTRKGDQNLGNMLSNTQNVNRPQGAPNPTSDMIK